MLGEGSWERVVVNERMFKDERVAEVLDKVDAPVYSMTDKQEKTISTVDTSPGCIAVAHYKADAFRGYGVHAYRHCIGWRTGSREM